MIEVTLVMPEMAAVLNNDINRHLLPKALTSLIKRAQFIGHNHAYQTLLIAYFNQQNDDTLDLPIISLSGVETPALRADPCYLHADRDKLRLFAKDLELDQEQAEGLIAEIQPLLTDLGMSLQILNNKAWQLNLTEQTACNFSAMERAEGQAIDSFLPYGAERQQWLQLWNEIQMQFHDCKVNQQRIAKKLVPINSVWFWGKGVFSPVKNRWTSVSGQSSLLKTLATRCDIPYLEQQTAFSEGNHLWLLPAFDTESDWQAQLTEYDTTIFKDLLQQVNKNKIQSLILDIPQLGKYMITAKPFWQFW